MREKANNRKAIQHRKREPNTNSKLIPKLIQN